MTVLSVRSTLVDEWRSSTKNLHYLLIYSRLLFFFNQSINRSNYFVLSFAPAQIWQSWNWNNSIQLSQLDSIKLLTCVFTTSLIFILSVCRLFFWRRQLEDDLTGGKTPSKPRPPPIKPLDLDAPRADDDAGGRQPITGRDGGAETDRARRRGTTFPKTTSSMIGWAQTLTPVMRNVQPLERLARPCGDIRKTFGWPPDGEWRVCVILS